MEEAPAHAHNAARGTFIEAGGVQQPAPAPRYSATPAGAPVMAGADDTHALLGELGYTMDRIDRLRSAGALK
jgi:alpha-methylacyl-CoA racemase